MTQDHSTIDVESRFEVAMELAEIAWCPNLNVSVLGSRDARAFLKIDPGFTKG